MDHIENLDKNKATFSVFCGKSLYLFNLYSQTGENDPWHITCFRIISNGLPLKLCHRIAIMSAFPENLKMTNLSHILQKMVEGRQTGCLRFTEGEKEGFIALENGIILNALTGPCTALHALFQFVQWSGAKIEFSESPIPPGFARDLAVYDPQVLISGVAYKEEEMTI